MSRLLRILLCLTLGLSLVSLLGCPTGDDDDDSSAGDDDDDDASDDDDTVETTDVAEVEPNDAHPFQDLGTLAAGRYAISGTGATAGHDPDDPMWMTGDLDLYSFQVAAGGTVDFGLDWDTAGDDFDMVLYEALTDTSELGWEIDEVINTGASEANPEAMSQALMMGTVYSVLVSNWEGADGSAYTLTIDVP